MLSFLCLAFNLKKHKIMFHKWILTIMYLEWEEKQNEILPSASTWSWIQNVAVQQACNEPWVISWTSMLMMRYSMYAQLEAQTSKIHVFEIIKQKMLNLKTHYANITDKMQRVNWERESLRHSSWPPCDLSCQPVTESRRSSTATNKHINVISHTLRGREHGN